MIYDRVLSELRTRLAEPAPARIQLLTGPRQVGKTTLLTQLARELVERALYVSADSAEAALPGWWENIWTNAERLARRAPAILLVDEIQYLSGWSQKLKAKSDYLRRMKTPVHVVATGSSAVQLSRGTKETMAGRFELLRLLHWPASELAKHFGMDESLAVKTLVRYGSYPGSIPLLTDPTRWRDYVCHSILEPAVGRDIMMLESIRKPALLRQIFLVAAGHPSEIISLQKICGQLGERGALETIAHYLSVLEDACLVAGIPKYSEAVLRQRAAPPKLIALNQAILSAFSGQPPPDETDAERWGRWVENACLAHAWNAGQRVHYWRAEPLEVDMVLEGDWGSWAVEIKTGRYGTRDLAGVIEFCRRHPNFRPLLLCREGDEHLAQQAGIACQPWPDFLLRGIRPGTDA